MSGRRSDLAQPGRLPRYPSGLTARARAAWAEARSNLGDADFVRFQSAVLRYVYAVDMADRMRAEWVRLGRPLVFVQPNKAQGQHPLIVGFLAASKGAAAGAAELGLTPMSDARLRRLGVWRGPGRPVGANSAPDRVALPGPLYAVRGLTPDGLPPVEMAREPARVKVNRARGHRVED